MSVIGEAEYKNILKARRGGVYILCGEENYLIKHYRDRVREPFLADGNASFNYITVPYSSREDADMIVSSAAQPAMMSLAGGKLIEVTVESPGSLSQADTDALTSALTESSGYDDCTVIWCISQGTLDLGSPPKRPSAIYKKLASLDGVSLVYFPETTPAQLRRWIERHFAHEGLTVDYDTADGVISVAGTDMTVLSSEIDKLTSYVKAHGRDRVTAADAREVCCRVDRYDAFSLSNAILDGRREDALVALDEERRRRTEPVVISAGIARVISDILCVKIMTGRGASASDIASSLGMHEYKVKLYMRAASSRSEKQIERSALECAEADRLLKSSGGGYSVLERLISAVGVRG